MKNVKRLEGLLPICSSCKKICTENGDWQKLEKYISEHASVNFSHGICPICKKELYPDFVRKNAK